MEEIGFIVSLIWPLWVLFGIVLIITYTATETWLKLGNIVGWVFFIGAPFIGTDLAAWSLSQMGDLPPMFGGVKPILSAFWASVSVGIGFSSIYSTKLILWASGNVSSNPKSSSAKNDWMDEEWEKAEGLDELGL